jgi:hypothetical protein
MGQRRRLIGEITLAGDVAAVDRGQILREIFGFDAADQAHGI